MLKEDEMRDEVMLVFEKKKELNTAMSDEEIKDKMGIKKMSNSNW
jgi:hypothetical protein